MVTPDLRIQCPTTLPISQTLSKQHNALIKTLDQKSNIYITMTDCLALIHKKGLSTAIACFIILNIMSATASLIRTFLRTGKRLLFQVVRVTFGVDLVF